MLLFIYNRVRRKDRSSSVHTVSYIHCLKMASLGKYEHSFYNVILWIWYAQAYIKKRVYTSLGFSLPTMRTPDSIVVCSCMYAFLLKRDPMRTTRCDSVRIGSHFHKNAYMHEQTTIGIHKKEVPKLVYTLSAVSQCMKQCRLYMLHHKYVLIQHQ